MISSRPYLLRAFYEWIVDNNLTPYLVVLADMPGVAVPRNYVENGRIVLNVSPEAVYNLSLENDHVEFSARFGGVPFEIFLPIRSVNAIYAKENGRGMVFKEEEEEEEGGSLPPPSPPSGTPKKEEKGKRGSQGKPNLTIVK